MVLKFENVNQSEKEADQEKEPQFGKKSKKLSRKNPLGSRRTSTHNFKSQTVNQFQGKKARSRVRSSAPRKRVRSLQRSRMASQMKSNGTKRAQSKGSVIAPPKLVGKDELIRDTISDLVASLHEVEQDRSDFLAFFQTHFLSVPHLDLRVFGGKQQTPFKEPQFAYPVTEARLKNVRIVSADAGVVTREYMGMNLSLISVALVDMCYKNDEIFSVDYFPNEDGKPHYSIHLQNTQQSTQVNKSQVSVKRALLEITIVLNYLRLNLKNPPDLVVLDGSVRIEPLQKLYNMDAEYMEIYRKLLHAYASLYDLCLTRNILLVGCVKNTSSIEFRDNLNRAFPTFLKKYPELRAFHGVRYRELFEDFNDTYLLYRLLDLNERSGVIELKKRELTRHEFGRIEEELAGYPLYCYYLQNVGFEMPLKIEFLYAPSLRQRFYNRLVRKGSDIAHETYLANKIASLILPLSNKIPDSSLPIPQIEAHMRATLTQQDFAMIEGEIKRQYYLKLFNRFNSQDTTEDEGDLTLLKQKKQFAKEFHGIFSLNRKSSPF